MEWQPIDTAPKDGTKFLAALSSGWILIMHEVQGRDGLYQWYATQGNTDVPIMRTHPGTLPNRPIATHWMPLPPPPG